MPHTAEQLDAGQLARHASNVFILLGRQPDWGRLIYRALELDPRHPEALRNLSDFFHAPGTEVFAGVVLEYALRVATPLDRAARKVLEDLRLLTVWSFGYARHRSGSTRLIQPDFADPTMFEVDEDSYRKYLDQVRVPAGSLEADFRAAHTLCGALSGFLAHRDGRTHVGLQDVLHPEQFVKTPAYDAWLHYDVVELDKLETLRQQNSEVS